MQGVARGRTGGVSPSGRRRPAAASRGMNPTAPHEQLRRLLCALGDAIRQRVLAARATAAEGELAAVAAVTPADTIYRVDKIGEEAIVAWFSARWPAGMPVEVVMEGLEGRASLTFPEGVAVEATQWKCLLDPIDGTRCLMHDKRSAWALAAIAPQRGPATCLADIAAAAMTELPTTKQWRADQISAVRGGGPAGVVAEGVNVLTGSRERLALRPSRATDFRHGFASFVRFFPEAKALTARLEEELWNRLVGLGRSPTPLIFDDQYLSTGGQIYEILAGHDRMIGDLRPLILPMLGLQTALSCHPYDICTALVLEEAGGIVEAPPGGPLTAPLDTTTPVAWIAFANETLANLVRPPLREMLRARGMV